MKDPPRKAFVKLIQDHQGIIQTICSVYYRTAEDRQDARQNIILQLWKAYPTFRAQAKISTWIYKVALNTVLANLRHESRQPQRLPLTEQTPLPAVLPPVDDDLQQLHQLINLLGDDEKALVILYLEGYRNNEIAEILSITISNVSTRLYRIKNKIRQLYKSYTDETR